MRPTFSKNMLLAKNGQIQAVVGETTNGRPVVLDTYKVGRDFTSPLRASYSPNSAAKMRTKSGKKSQRGSHAKNSLSMSGIQSTYHVQDASQLSNNQLSNDLVPSILRTSNTANRMISPIRQANGPTESPQVKSAMINNSFGAERTFWYFAIGSMMNPISLSNRKLVPKESKPAELLDHRLYFFGSLGMAEAIADEGYSFHGVLHKMDEATMAELDKIEFGYTRKDGIAKLYDGSTVPCTVYAREGKERGPHIDKPPTQRYLEIMMMGAKHFGVVQSHIDYLNYHEQQKRHLPHEFEGYYVPPGTPMMTYEEVERMDGQDGRPLANIINGKVL